MRKEDEVLCFNPNLNINRHFNPKDDTFNYTYICRDDEKILLKDLWEEHKQLKRLQAENKRLQMLSCANCGEQYLSPDGAELYEKNVQLQAENERLKALCNTYLTCYKAKHNDIEGNLFSYHKALEEMREIVKTCINNEQDGCYGCKYFDKCDIEDAEIPTRDVCKPIIGIIDEALK